MEISERIIIEAGSLFARYGIRSVTMDSLAEDMCISKRTIYENFRDKDTLLLEVIRYFQAQQLEEFDEIITSSSNIIEGMFGIIQRTISYMKQLNPLFFHDMKRYHSQIFKQLAEEGQIRDQRFTRTILLEGIKQKIVRDDLNLDIVNRALHELFNMFSPDHEMTSTGYDRAELFDNIIIPFLLGICTEKGKKLISKQGKFTYNGIKTE